MKPVSKENSDSVFAEVDFPKSVASVSANKAFEKELVRLRGLSVEKRIMEALSLHDAFSWLDPVVKTEGL